MLSSIRLTISYIIYNAIGNANVDNLDFKDIGIIHRPKNYILTSLMVNVINIIAYMGILIILETGYLRQFFNYIKVKFLIKETNVTFSNEQMSDEFLSNNNLESQNMPLLKNPDMEDNNLLNPMINPINSINARSDSINNNLNNDNNTNNINNCIQNEINKINNDNENKLTTKIIALKKTYWQCCKKDIKDINNLYLGLENNEKFGLLGFNGSGKTTTLKSITREILYDSGEIILFGKNNKKQFNEIRQSIGYCPQENPLFYYMKVKEIIKFYLKLKGIRESINDICEKFGLGKYLETYCINLSGGNKRKLSFAIALMCKPKILLLNEPSTSVDPESRRIMWKKIMELSKKNKNLNIFFSFKSNIKFLFAISFSSVLLFICSCLSSFLLFRYILFLIFSTLLSIVTLSLKILISLEL